MKFSTFHLFAVPERSNEHDVLRAEFDEMRLAEQLGFYSVWLAEHNARPYGIVGDVATAAAAVAAATKRIRIVTGVTRLPMHHPLTLAQNLAFVDQISNGRLDWGIGKGYDSFEFTTYGIPFEEREERW